MNLTIKIQTNFNIKPENDSTLIIEELQKHGLIILNEKKFEFTEKYNFTTHSGENKMKIFHPLLKGSLEIETENEFNYWNLQIDSVLIKSFFLTVISFLIFHPTLEHNSLIYTLLPISLGGILFLINRKKLDIRIKKISESIKTKL